MKCRLFLIGLLGWVCQANASPLLQAHAEKIVKLSPPAQVKTKPQPTLAMKEIKLFTHHIVLVAPSELQSAPTIIKHTADTLMATTGDQVLADKIIKGSPKQYYIITSAKPYVDAATKTVLGYSAVVVAEAELKQAGMPATLKIIKSLQEFKAGTKLLVKPTVEKQQLRLYKPQQAINGAILAIINNHAGAANDVVVINKGQQDGLAPGALLSIHSHQYPDRKIGKLVIVKTLPHLSLGLIQQATQIIAVAEQVKNLS